MPVRLFVGNLAHEGTEAEVRELFLKAGRPTYVRVPTDRETGAPRGFAFVEFEERREAEEAIRTLDRQLFKGRPLSVSEARPKDPSTDRRTASSFVSGEEAGPRQEGRPPNRNFGPDAPARGKRRPERRESRDGAPKARSRPTTSRPGFEELDGPDDFALWKTVDGEQED